MNWALPFQLEPCSIHSDKKGILSQQISYKNPNNEWLKTITDEFEIIPSTTFLTNFVLNDSGEEINNLDCLKDKPFNKSDNIFSPYSVCDFRLRLNSTSNNIPYLTPAWFNNSNAAYYLKAATTSLSKLSNVDIILTPDKSKWSRCIVIETMNVMHENEGLVSEKNSTIKGKSFDLRVGASVGTDTDPDAASDGTIGKSWFPGYAIDVETGQRLNIIFGENSGYDAYNDLLKSNFNLNSNQLTGRDMIWNPTSDIYIQNVIPNIPTSAVNLIGACGHYIYVTNTPYDGCKEYFASVGSSQFNRNIAKSTIWTAMPYLAAGANLLSYKDGIIPNECTINLRVNNPYQVEHGVGTNNNYPSYGFKIDKNTIAVKNIQNVNEDNFNIFPNPLSLNSNSILNINNLPKSFDLNIYGLDAKLYYSKKFNELENPTLTLSSSELKISNAGIYLVVIKSEIGIQTKKIVITNN